MNCNDGNGPSSLHVAIFFSTDKALHLFSAMLNNINGSIEVNITMGTCRSGRTRWSTGVMVSPGGGFYGIAEGNGRSAGYGG